MTTARCEMRTADRPPLLRAVDCVTVPVPDLDTGLAFYRGALGHGLLWRNDDLGQAGMAMPEAETELVLTTRQPYAPGWLVASADQAAERIRLAGGRVITEPFDTPVGRLAVTADPLAMSWSCLTCRVAGTGPMRVVSSLVRRHRRRHQRDRRQPFCGHVDAGAGEESRRRLAGVPPIGGDGWYLRRSPAAVVDA